VGREQIRVEFAPTISNLQSTSNFQGCDLRARWNKIGVSSNLKPIWKCAFILPSMVLGFRF